MTYSQTSWRNKGLGWIPDLPDVSDPSIQQIIGDTLNVQSPTDVKAVEEAVHLLVDIFERESSVQQKDLRDIKTKLLGNTRFPNVKVYKILRKQPDLSDQSAQRSLQSKEIIQLKAALYLIYKKPSQNGFKLDKAKKFEEIFGSYSSELIEWLQESVFDADLEGLVIDFQNHADLIGDGIVGLRTITAMQEALTGQTASADYQKPQTVELLCPLTLIPHDVLAEVFKQLIYRWLYGRFKCKIDFVFQKFLKQNSLDKWTLDSVKKAWHSLDSFVQDELQHIGAKPRKQTDQRENEEQPIFDENFVDCMSYELPKFCLRVAHKSQQLLKHDNLENFDNEAIQDSREIDRQIDELTGLIIDQIIGTNIDGSDRSSRIQELNDWLKNWEGADKQEREIGNILLEEKLETIYKLVCPQGQIFSEDYEDTFIFYSYSTFIREFQRWFHIIEPFTAAVFQILSPLAGFDDVRQGVNHCFKRLESSFQLYQLIQSSIISPYDNLLINYSPGGISEQIEELQSQRDTVTDLFMEVLAKIERTYGYDLKFRLPILNYLKEISSEKASKDDFFQGLKIKLNPENLDQQSSKQQGEANKNWEHLWENFIKPIAGNIFSSREDFLESTGKDKIDTVKSKSDFFEQQESDIRCFIAFLGFFEDIIQDFLVQYGIASKDDFQGEFRAFRYKARRNSVEQREQISRLESLLASEKHPHLASLLTAKKELFEIDFSLSSESSSEKPQDSQLFKPTQSVLAVSADLLNLALEKKQNQIRHYFFLPGVVDLSYWCSPVEDQGTVNACTAFAGIALVEYFAQKQYGKYANLSARFLYKAARNLMSRLDDEGASVRKTMEALVLFGVPPEKTWPWSESGVNEEPPAFCYSYAQSYQALKYFRLDTPAVTTKDLLLFQIKAVLAAGLPCMFGFTIYNSFFKEKSIRLGHIPLPSTRDQIVGGHAAVAVGYNDYVTISRLDGQPTKPGAILIRNSWGTHWGKGGYGWLPYEYVLKGLTADWWSLLKSEWLDGGAFGIGAVDPGDPKPDPRQQ